MTEGEKGSGRSVLERLGREGLEFGEKIGLRVKKICDEDVRGLVTVDGGGERGVRAT